jgi:hypothetical protein
MADMTPTQALAHAPASAGKTTFLTACDAFLTAVDALETATKINGTATTLAKQDFVDLLERVASNINA